ncbi:MAG: YciI family protein [Micrococcales bacterium]|nr:YciI family protein [Micrococcales bacterium]
MHLFAVLYTYVDRPSDLDAARPAHRAWLKDLFDEGVVLLAGPMGEPGGAGGLILVRANDLAEAAAIMDADPFEDDDLIASRLIRPFIQVYGTLPA